MLRVEGLQFKRGDEVLFENLTFVIHPGQCAAIAGRNGVGKSTLFHLLRGKLNSDIGDIYLPSSWRVGFMEQEVAVTQRPALEYVVDGHAELRRVEDRLETTTDPAALATLHTEYADLNGYEAHARAGEILYGLGFSGDEFDKPFAEFSGGWRIRLNLAQALMSPCDLLMLDEPTNHLDLEAIMWLENWLKRFQGTVLIIAHDRSFLDACTDHTLYLTAKSGRLYNGNYSSCERQRAEQMEQEAAMQSKQQAQAAHIQKFVDRFRAKASKAKQVQSRIKALERMQLTASVQADSPYQVGFQNPDKVSNPLFSFRNMKLGYDANVVLSDLSHTTLPGDRIGVLGANGVGKSTLLKAIVGDLTPLAGELTHGQHCDVGYFAQHQLETLNAKNSALQTFLNHQTDWREQQCRDYLGGWGFSADMTTRPVATLSGGEKARLVLAMLASNKPALLVLDEPTNHLDLDMREALALALQDFEGAVIIVSHDRSLLEKTVDDFWVLRAGTMHRFRGDIADYTAAEPAAASTGDPNIADESSRKVARQQRAAVRENLKALRDEVRQQEKRMEAEQRELQGLERQLADKETYESLPTEELDLLLSKAGKLRSRLERTEELWLEATDALEQAQSPD